MGTCGLTPARVGGDQIKDVTSTRPAAMPLQTALLQKTLSMFSPLIKACLKKTPADTNALAHSKALQTLRANVHGE